MPNEGPQIIFLNYKIFSHKDDQIKVRFINSIINKGKIKGPGETSLANPDGFYKVAQLDHNSDELISKFMPDPLVKDVEYLDENNNFQKKRITVDSAFLSIRMDLLPATRAIAISKIRSFNEVKVLHIHPVKN